MPIRRETLAVLFAGLLGCTPSVDDVDTGGDVERPRPFVRSLATDQGEVAAIAADTREVFWTMRGTPVFDAESNKSYSISDGLILRMPADGGQPVILASGQANPTALALDDDHVYWSTAESGGVWRLPRTGGVPERLFEGDHITALAIDDTHVYFPVPHENSIRRVPKQGGPSEVLIKGSKSAGLRALALEGDDLIYAVHAGDMSTDIRSVPRAGGASVLLATVSGLSVGWIGANPTWIHGTTLGTPDESWEDGGIWRIPRAGGAVEPLVTGQPCAWAGTMASGSLLWGNQCGDGGLRRRSLIDGTISELTRGPGTTQAITAVGSTIFWTATDAGGGGYVVRADL